MAKIGLPKGSGKQSKVREKSGNFEMNSERQSWFVIVAEAGVSVSYGHI